MRLASSGIAALALFGLLAVEALAAGTIWISHHELGLLPVMPGLASYDGVVDEADDPYTGNARLVDAADANGDTINVDVETLARAYLCSREGNFCSTARQALVDLMASDLTPDSQPTHRDYVLSAGRNLLSYVIAADVLESANDAGVATGWTATDRANLVTWLGTVLAHEFSPEIPARKTLRLCADNAPHNWGAHCNASRMAAGYYRGGATDSDYTQSITVTQGFLGDRSVYTFDHATSEWDSDTCASDRSWACPQVGSADPVLRPINEAGCTLSGIDVGGVIPDDQSRNENCPGTPTCPVDPDGDGDGTFRGTTPFCNQNYPYESLQGLTAQVWIAERTVTTGSTPSSWSTSALRRVIVWLTTPEPAGNGYVLTTSEDDIWIHPVLNCLYQMTLTPTSATREGKNMGYTLWTHGEDLDADLVPNLCDSCPKLANALASPLAFQTTTGGQHDDDADGWGNRCDADFNDLGGTVDSTDFALFKGAFGLHRNNDAFPPEACLPGAQPSPAATNCDKYDHNNAQATIDSIDFAMFKALFGLTKKQDSDLLEKCTVCPLACSGDACQ